MAINRRIFQRYNIKIPCDLNLMDGKSCHGYVKNISLDGLFMQTYDHILFKDTDKSIAVSKQGVIRLRQFDDDFNEPIVLRCRIIHITSHGIGLSANFFELSRDDLNILEKIIHRH